MPRIPAAPNNAATNFNDMCEAASLFRRYTRDNVYVNERGRSVSEVILNAGKLLQVKFIEIFIKGVFPKKLTVIKSNNGFRIR